MNDRFESLESGEVISVQHDTLVLSGHRTFRVGELNEAIETHLKKAIENWNDENSAWFTDRGLDCEALRFGSKGWRKGRIRLCLEFCPDEPDALSQPVAVNATTTSLGATSAPSAVPAPPTPTASHDDRHDRPTATAETEDRGNFAATTTPAPSETPAEPEGSSLPLAGMTAMGAAAVVATIATPVATATPAPHFTDTTLESEEQPSDAGVVSGNLDEIAYVFGHADERGVAAPNGMMELDLTDLGMTDLSLDFSEHDMLSFESQGISDGMDEFINLQDIGKSENSGMLIDEVWNELNQGNWTGSN